MSGRKKAVSFEEAVFGIAGQNSCYPWTLAHCVIPSNATASRPERRHILESFEKQLACGESRTSIDPARVDAEH